MTKVVFFINSLSGGGAERILTTILYELKDQYKLTLVLIEDKIVYDIPNDVNVICLNRRSIQNSKLFKLLYIGLFSYKLARICNQLNVNYSFSLTTRPNLINSLSLLFGKKCKSITYEVATPSVMYGDKSISSKIVKKMIKYIYPMSNTIITNSTGVARDLKINFSIKKEIQTVYSPIDLDYIKKLSIDLSNTMNQEGFLKFITIGRLDYGKNHKMMIEAFSNIKNKKTILYILGSGELEKDLKILVQDLKMEKRIVFLGFDNNPFKYLKQCDVFLFSSRFEGFPTVLIEALACGLPIISTDCLSGPREILSEVNDFKQIKDDIEVGEYGILTPLDNQKLFEKAINEIAENIRLRDKYKNGALQRANFFSKDYSIEQIKQILKEEE